MSNLEELLGRVEELLGAVDELEQPASDMAFELLDGIDALHRLALGRLAQGIDAEVLDRLRDGDPAAAWLLDVYGIGVDQHAAAERVSNLEELLGRMEELLGAVDELEQPASDMVFELLDGVDALHRLALGRLAQGIDAEVLDRLRDGDPAVAWLLDFYGIGVDQHAAAERALEQILPYVHSHGGEVEVLEAGEGVVRLRMSGACAGCTASATTITETIEEALREHVPGFSRAEVEEEEAPSHPPPGPVLVQLEPPSR